MADLAKSAVEIVDGWEHRQPGRNFTLRQFVLTLTGQGGTTNKIPASVLGFAKIKQAYPGVSASNANIVVAAPSLDGSMLLLKASATDAPADFTGTLTILVGGDV
jgi:hypothetical protein